MPMAPWRIRPAERGDAAAMAAVLKAAFEPHEASYTPAGYRATTPDAYALLLRWSEGRIWVAVVDKAVVGTVGVVEGPDHWHVRSMAVHPEHLGRGLGKALLRAVIREAEAEGVAELRLCTTSFLGPAIALYHAHGFVDVPHTGPDLHGTPLMSMVRRRAATRVR